jgi:hypothetical protein
MIAMASCRRGPPQIREEMSKGNHRETIAAGNLESLTSNRATSSSRSGILCDQLGHLVAQRLRLCLELVH